MIHLAKDSSFAVQRQPVMDPFFFQDPINKSTCCCEKYLLRLIYLHALIQKFINDFWYSAVEFIQSCEIMHEILWRYAEILYQAGRVNIDLGSC